MNIKIKLKARLHNFFKEIIEEDNKNIERQQQRKALLETVEFIDEQMNNIQSFPDKFSLLQYSLNNVKINGLYLEFGVYNGESINFISSKINNDIYGFDSFEGLPEFWRDGFEKGTFALNKMPSVNENVRLVQGWFNETLPGFIKEQRQDCAFIHIDCDLYSSTKTIFELLQSKIISGTVIVFDEFFNYYGWKKGEYKAFFEFIKGNNLKFEYIGYCRYHEQVAVKVIV